LVFIFISHFFIYLALSFGEGRVRFFRAIEWIMERYAITTNKDSGITNNPNDWQVENPRYIFNLLLSIIRVSVETVRIVENLTKIE
jgi:predicted helicase